MIDHAFALNAQTYHQHGVNLLNDAMISGLLHDDVDDHLQLHLDVFNCVGSNYVKKFSCVPRHLSELQITSLPLNHYDELLMVANAVVIFMICLT